MTNPYHYQDYDRSIPPLILFPGKKAGPFCGSFLRKGEVSDYNGRNQNLKDMISAGSVGHLHLLETKFYFRFELMKSRVDTLLAFKI